jgi:hypothetical protein
MQLIYMENYDVDHRKIIHGILFLDDYCFALSLYNINLKALIGHIY